MDDPGKTRSLAEVNRIFQAFGPIEAVIDDALSRSRSVHVLEVGFGWGRVLLELAWRYRGQPVTVSGVDAKCKPPVRAREDLRTMAERFGIGAQSDFASLPDIAFYDATTLRVPDESIDCLYSAVTIRFMQDKIAFIEEVCRVLKPGGQALLHLGESHWNYPYHVITDSRILTPYTARLVIKHGVELIPLPIVFHFFSGPVCTFALAPEGKCVLKIVKRQSGRLRFRLRFNRSLSMPSLDVPLRNRHGDIRTGYRSVYDIPVDLYNALFERELLTRDRLRCDIALPKAWIQTNAPSPARLS